MIRYIIYEEADEYLNYEMERLISYHEQNNNLPDFHKVAAILEDVKFDKPVFRDTLILEPGDNEMVPHRELYFSINHNGKYFTIVLRHLLPGNDDILQGAFLIMVGLIVIIAITLFLILSNISGKIWKPFYKTLNAITKFQMSEPLPVFPDTPIDEFNTLNNTLQNLLKKISKDFLRTKEFNENASHELQTHLAIIRANTEKLLNEYDDKPVDPEIIQKILNATIKLSQAQKSLLLLSKIGNLEFKNPVETNLKETLNLVLDVFLEAIEIRNISLVVNSENCFLSIDPGLSSVMLTNLIKNAVKHNIQDGYISIQLTQNTLVIENSGSPFDGKPDVLLDRFIKGEQGNLGIGLSIVKQICELYNFHISYRINSNIHIIQISFP